MVGIEKEREIKVAMKADRENGREARNSRPSTMVEIFIMVISLDFLGLSLGARDFFGVHYVCLETMAESRWTEGALVLPKFWKTIGRNIIDFGVILTNLKIFEGLVQLEPTLV